MIVLLICAQCVSAIVALTFLSVIRSMTRQQAREREALQNKLMHLAGRTWEPPPADLPEPELPALHVMSDEPDADLY